MKEIEHVATNGTAYNSGPQSMRRPRVLLSAYSCCPNWGSEPGVGWNRAKEIARYCDVWVLTRSDGMQPRIVAYLEEHGPISNLEFVYVPRTDWELAIGSTWPLKYLSYRRWVGRAFSVAQRLHAQVQFDIAHHVTFNGFREPSCLYKLGVPFVWGPVGGAQNYPWRFLGGAGFAGGSREAMRSIANDIQLFTSPRVRRAARAAATIFAANPENKQKLHRALGADSILMSDAGAAPLKARSSARPDDSEALKILWAGNLDTWKALELLIEALALLPKEVPFELHVLGDGRRRSRWQALAEKRGIASQVRWCGRLPHDEALAQFRWADVFAFTSLRDTSGTVVLEALAAGTPIICLDHQGVGAIVTPDCGIKVPVTTRPEVYRGLANAIARLQGDRGHCRALADGAYRRASEYLWTLQAQKIAEEYNRILERNGSDARCDLEAPNDFVESVWQDAPMEKAIARV